MTITATPTTVTIDEDIALAVAGAIDDLKPEIAAAIADGLRSNNAVPVEDLGGMTLRTGTVDAVYSDGHCDVVLDGDGAATTPCTLLNGATIGQRVAVVFSPPSGGLVLGTFGAVAGGGTPPTGALLGSVPNTVTATTSLVAYGGTVPGWEVRATNGTEGAPSATVEGNELGYYEFGGFGATGALDGVASFRAFAAEDHSDTAGGAWLSAWTTPTGTTTPAEAARATADQSWVVGNRGAFEQGDLMGAGRFCAMTTISGNVAVVATGVGLSVFSQEDVGKLVYEQHTQANFAYDTRIATVTDPTHATVTIAPLTTGSVTPIIGAFGSPLFSFLGHDPDFTPFKLRTTGLMVGHYAHTVAGSGHTDAWFPSTAVQVTVAHWFDADPNSVMDGGGAGPRGLFNIEGNVWFGAGVDQNDAAGGPFLNSGLIYQNAYDTVSSPGGIIYGPSLSPQFESTGASTGILNLSMVGGYWSNAGFNSSAGTTIDVGEIRAYQTGDGFGESGTTQIHRYGGFVAVPPRVLGAAVDQVVMVDVGAENYRALTGLSNTAASATVTSATPQFFPGDVGAIFHIAGGTGVGLYVRTYNSSTSITLNAALGVHSNVTGEVLLPTRQAYSGATVNVGIRNAMPTVWTPDAQVLAATGTTLSPIATMIQAFPTGNSVLNGTLNITTANQQNGQVLRVFNNGPGTVTYTNTKGVSLPTATLVQDPNTVAEFVFMVLGSGWTNRWRYVGSVSGASVTSVDQPSLPNPKAVSYAERGANIALAARGTTTITEVMLMDSFDSKDPTDPEQTTFAAVYEKMMAKNFNFAERTAGFMNVAMKGVPLDDAGSANVGVIWDHVGGTWIERGPSFSSRLLADVTASTTAGGVTTNLSTTVTNSGWALTSDDVGRGISGTNIPAGAYIVRLTPGSTTSAIISAAATGTGSGITFTIKGQFDENTRGADGLTVIYTKRQSTAGTLTVAINGVVQSPTINTLDAAIPSTSLVGTITGGTALAITSGRILSSGDTGLHVTGSGIPAGTTITYVDGTHATLSAVSTNAAGVAIALEGFDVGYSTYYASPDGYTSLDAKVTCSSGSAQFDAGFFHNTAGRGDVGYRLFRCSRPGWRMQFHLQGATAPNAYRDGVHPDALMLIKNQQPQIVTIVLGVNDANQAAPTFYGLSGAETSTQFGDNITAMFAAIRAQYTTNPPPAIRYVFQWENNISPMTAHADPENWLTDYKEAAREAVRADGDAMFIDMAEALGSVDTTDPRNLTADNIHPEDAANYTLGQLLAEVTIPRNPTPDRAFRLDGGAATIQYTNALGGDLGLRQYNAGINLAFYRGSGTGTLIAATSGTLISPLAGGNLVGAISFGGRYDINGGGVEQWAVTAQMRAVVDLAGGSAWSLTSLPTRFEWQNVTAGVLFPTVKMILDNAGTLSSGTGWTVTSPTSANWYLTQAGAFTTIGAITSGTAGQFTVSTVGAVVTKGSITVGTTGQFVVSNTGALTSTGGININSGNFVVTASTGAVLTLGSITAGLAGQFVVSNVGALTTVSLATFGSAGQTTIAATGAFTTSAAIVGTGSLTIGTTGQFVVSNTGALTSSGGININSGKFVVLAASGNTTVLGTLDVGSTGQLAVTAAGAVTTSGAITGTNTLDIGTTGQLHVANNGAVTTTGSITAGSTGQFVVTNVGVVTSTTSIKSTGATNGIGYGVGAGSSITQTGTARTAGVTLNFITGQITTSTVASVANGVAQTFVLTNSAIAATDTLIVQHTSGGTTGAYNIWVSNIAAGSCSITVRNVGGSTLTSEAPVLTFTIIKSVIT